jgi:hypothetical protein
MAVTDMTDSLPWWATQGTQDGGMPGGAPGGPSGASWLQYLQQMFGISPAQAGELQDPTAALRSALASRQTQSGPPDIPVGPNTVPQIQPPQPPQGPPGYLRSTSATQPPPPLPQGGVGAGLAAPNYTNPFLAAGVGPGAGLNAGTPIQAPTAQRPPQGPPGYLNSTGATGGVPIAQVGGASGVGATSNPRFVQIDRPNLPASGIGSARGPNAPQMTALNLAGLFGGPAGPQGGPAAAPQGARPVAGPLAARGGPQRVPLDQTPGPPVMPPDIAAARAAAARDPRVARARMLQPNYYT